MKKGIILSLFIAFSICGKAQFKAFNVTVTGKGDPILFFPGFACTAEVWNETVAALSPQHECHTFTFAGFGGVPAIDTPWLTTIKEAIINYVKVKNLKNITIIGHSRGGTLGMWLSASQKTLFKKVIVVDGLPSTGALMIPNFKAGSLLYNNPFAKQQLAMDSTTFKAMAMQMAASMCFNKAAQSQLTNWMCQADRKTYVYGYIDLLNLDLRDEIENIAVPVVVLAATQPTKQIVEKTWNQQLAKLSNKTVYYAENSAHFIMYDQPQWLIEKIKEAL
jgi:pimeloyl-ACP methyl ester carboxylesterase